MEKEIVSVKPKIVSLNETNDIYMTLNLCILSNVPNLNDLHFTDDYINGIVENKNHFIGIPLVVNREKLESGLYDKLSHELDRKTGILNTNSIGSFVDFWEETDEDGVKLLMGSVRVQKRYPNVCNAMIELYEENELEFSCEVYAYGFSSVDEETGVRSLDYKYDGQVNSLFGSAIVSNGAEVRSKATLLIAEAHKKDLKGGEQVAETVDFNKGIDIKYHGKIQIASLKYIDISNQIYNILNPINPKNNYRDYNYYITDLYNDHVIVEDWDDYSTLYRINYEITNDIVVLDPEDKWVKGYSGFIPEGIDVDELITAKEQQVIETNNKIDKLNNQHKEELNSMDEKTQEQIKELQSTIDGLNTKVKEFEGKVEELNGVVVSQKEDISSLQEKETQLNSTIEELKPFKEKVETAEKTAKKENLTIKYSKLVSEEISKSEEFQSALNELNVSALDSIVVAEVAKGIKSKDENKDEQVVVVAEKDEDLIPASVLQKYGI